MSSTTTPGDEPETSPEPSPSFEQFRLDPQLLRTVAALGFDTPTPIQARAIEPLLAGRDVVGRARTGSGKTAAFGLPLLQGLQPGAGGGPQALVLAPTRELALQVTEALRSYAEGSKARLLTVYGGAAYGPQVNGLRRGVEVVVGTPGRLIDLMTRKLMDLSTVRMVVIDEADELLRMGFIDDVEKLLADTPPTRQVALFSATMPPPIRQVAEAYLKNPVELQVEQQVLSVDHIEQCWMRVPYYHKPEALERVLRASPGSTALVFARTRAECADAADGMTKRGFTVEALHGDLSQAARENVMQRFRARRIRVVIATDVAARGLDVEHISHVINFDLPDTIESYVHRIGRTGRAGRKGIAMSFVTPRELHRIPTWQRRLKVRIEEIAPPSDAEIAAAQLRGLEQELGQALEDTSAAGVARTGLTRLMEKSGLSAEDVATAALTLMAQTRGLSFEAKRDERPPHWARFRQKSRRDERRVPGYGDPSGRPTRDRRPSSGPRPDFSAVNEVEIFLATGAHYGVRPQDVVGAIANEKSIPGKQIGRITLLDYKCFVGLSKANAERVLKDGNKLAIRGQEVHMSLARPREPMPQDRRPDHRRPDHPRPDQRRGDGTDRPIKPRQSGKPAHPGKPGKPTRPGKPARPGKPGKSGKPMWSKFDKSRRGKPGLSRKLSRKNAKRR